MYKKDLKSRLLESAVPCTIAALLGAILLIICHKYTDEHSFLHHFTHEIGFALVVAVLIYLAFEFYRSGKVEQEWNERVKQISDAVFRSIFGNKLPEEYIKEVVASCIELNFYREKMTQSYAICDATYKDRNGIDKQFVKVEVTADYIVRNIGDTAELLPVAIGLPNPIIDEMKPYCKVTSVDLIRNGKPDAISIEDAEKKFRELIANDNSALVNFVLPSINLDPGEAVQIIFRYSMAKEEEDSELFQTRYPAENTSLTVFDKGPTKRVVKARSIGSKQIEVLSENEETGAYSYQIRNYLLPRHGFVVWWKKVPDSAK